MNQRTLPYERAEDREALIDGLAVSHRMRKMLKFLDQWGRRAGTCDARYVKADPPRFELLAGVGVSGGNKKVWAELRSEWRACPFLMVAESNSRSHAFRIDWVALVDASSWCGRGGPSPDQGSAHQGVTGRALGGNCYLPMGPSGGNLQSPPSPPKGAHPEGGVHPLMRAPQRGRGKGAHAREIQDPDLGLSKLEDPNPRQARPASSAQQTRPHAAPGPRFWGRELQPRELSDPRSLAELFGKAVERGRFAASEQSLLDFLALAHYTRRAWHNKRRKPEASPVALFTAFVTGTYLANAQWPRPWSERLIEIDFAWARAALRTIRGDSPPERPPASFAEGAGDDDLDRKRAAALAALDAAFPHDGVSPRMEEPE